MPFTLSPALSGADPVPSFPGSKFFPDENSHPLQNVAQCTEECTESRRRIGSSSEESVLSSLRELETLVEGLLASWVGNAALPRRRFHRVAYRRPVAITPLCDETLQAAGETRRVETRDLSRAGLSFRHCHPLDSRLVAVTFPRNTAPPETIVLRLTWCRFTRNGVYYSGGRFLRRRNFGWEANLDCSCLSLG